MWMHELGSRQLLLRFAVLPGLKYTENNWSLQVEASFQEASNTEPCWMSIWYFWSESEIFQIGKSSCTGSLFLDVLKQGNVAST